MSETTYEITGFPGDPFSATPPDSEAPIEDPAFPVSINNRGFMVDLSDDLSIYHRFQRSSVNLLNTQQAQSSGDLAQVPPEVWRRVVESWEAGAGQSRYDRESSNPARFYDSRGVDVWDPWKASLLHETASVQDLGAGRVFLSTVGPSRLVAVQGSDSFWWTDLTVTPTNVALANEAVDVTTDGEALYVLDSTGAVTRWTDPTTSAAFATIASPVAGRMLLRYLNGFLVVGNGPSLYDISTGTPALIYTHPLDGFTWRDGSQGPSGGYLLGGVGDRWSLYVARPKADGTTLDVPVVAAPLPDGEVGYSCSAYLGYVMVGSGGGWRFGVGNSDGSVSLGRLIPTAGPVYCFEGQDRFVWYGLSSGSLDDVTIEHSGLGRADLSTFTSQVTPAFAADLASDATGDVWAVTTFGATALRSGWRVFAVDGQGVYAERDTLVPSGWLQQGAINFGSSDPKVGLYAQVYYERLYGGQIKVEARYDDGAWKEVASAASDQSVTMGNIRIDQMFDSLDLRLTLTRDALSTNLGPVLTRAEIRALPVPGRASEWRIPLLLDETQLVDTIVKGRDVVSDYDMLVGLQESRREFAYREGERTWRLFATDYVWWPRKLTIDGKTYQGTFILTAREVR